MGESVFFQPSSLFHGEIKAISGKEALAAEYGSPDGVPRIQLPIQRQIDLAKDLPVLRMHWFAD